MIKKYNGKSYEFTDDGYLKSYKDWDEELAKELAKEIGIGELTDKHWQVINFLRDYFEKNEISPSLRKITRESGVSTKEVYSLFPDGPAKKAALVAGIPKPQGCV